MSGVKRTRTTRTGTGSSSQEQEVADPMMTLERRMEYLRGRPVAKEPVTLSDFDQLLYEEHSLYQLFEYQDFFISSRGLRDRAPEVQLEVRGLQFLFSADIIADFLHCPRPETPYFLAVPLMDEQRTSEQDLWTLMTGKTSAVVGSIIKQRECIVAYLHNKAVVAHMKEVNEQQEEIKKTLDDFKKRQIHRRFPEIFLMTWRLSVMLFSLDVFMIFLLSI
ncbi:hypothetical protein CJ030_MR6G010348 [Morella rubra]|uniref:Uncharacterized protein n=1 Tax=Morella rubra TaxID=262757 RepID=A0A6A1WT10_9ROSI|nr:hypothetical protein CJ030_MR6G010348 [Morella rubra]